MATPILITVPKYVTIPNKNGIPICSDDSNDEVFVRGKKRRLDHLSWEEKLQRKWVTLNYKWDDFLIFYLCFVPNATPFAMGDNGGIEETDWTPNYIVLSYIRYINMRRKKQFMGINSN